jgi:FkbM family methyltransferase
MVNARTVRGLLPLTASEVRLLSPYSDEPLEMAMLARFLQPGMTAVDVGANRGTYSLMFSARVGERGSVLAVEPDARMLARLQSLRSLNGLQDVLTIVAGAVAAASGERVLSLETEPALNHLLPESGFLSSSRTATVKALTYVDLISRYSLDGVDLLKVDVEGAEPEVLASVLACHDRDLQPTVIMFEFVPAHWQRLGQHALAPTAAALGVHYHLFAIDYGSGSLLPFGDSGLPAWGGRNVLAIHRTNSHDALRRIGLGPFRPIEVDESTVFHFPSAATGVADSPP